MFRSLNLPLRAYKLASAHSKTGIASTIVRKYKDETGNLTSRSHIKGSDYLKNATLNKGLAFTIEERQSLGIHGLQPARIKTQEEQLALIKLSYNRITEPLNQYVYLQGLQDRHEQLFFRLLSENIEELMPIVNTPTVGHACRRFGLIYRRPRGIFLTINDRGHIFDILKNWPKPEVRLIVVTDGERVLSLGDLGAYGMGIPVGKLTIYVAAAGIQPHKCLPIVLDVGTNNNELLEDPLYVGLRQKRAEGPEYDEFLDEFMEAVVRRYGQHTLIQFEDFGHNNAYRLLDKYRDVYCTFNDDIQGTAAVALAGIYAANRITNQSLKDHVYLFAGAGSVSTGIANLITYAMIQEGISKEEACCKIWMYDAAGLLVNSRKDIAPQQQDFVKDHEEMKNLQEIIDAIKPSVLIGASSTAGLFTEAVLRSMVSHNERPIVFALSNPASQAECSAEDAYGFTDGRAIFISGSPFPPVTLNGKTYRCAQGCNAYVFPGVALGVLASEMHHIPDDLFLVAAREISETVDEEDLKEGSLYPPIKCIRELSFRMGIRIAQYGYDKGLASEYPEPKDKCKWLESKLYDYNYKDCVPILWSWPPAPAFKTKELLPLNEKKT